MRKAWWRAALGAIVLVFAVGAVAIAHGGNHRNGLKAHLSGYQETPSIVSPATGKFKAKINGDQIDYKLSYSGFTSPVHFAHIHLGQFGVAGGVAAFLCGGGGKPDCPQGSGEVTGTIVAADVQAIPAQGLVAGDIAALIDAIRHGVTYANVHTDNFPSGEIRGQIGGGKFKGFFGQKGQGDFGKHGDFGRHGHGGKDD
jgi:hypothetical protein